MRLSSALVSFAALALAACGEPEGEPLEFETSALVDGYVGEGYDQPLTVNGGAPPYVFTVSTGAPPSGLTLTAAGALEGTPTEAGAFTFTITVADANGDQATSTLTLTVYAPPALSFDSPPDLYVGTAFSQQATATGGKPPLAWELASGALPPGISLTAEGLVAGAATSAGTHQATLRITDANGKVATRAVQFLVFAPPELTTETLLAGELGSAYSQVIRTSGGKAPLTFTVTSGALPDGLSLQNGTLLGTPTAEGEFEFTVELTDANGLTDSVTFTVTIYPVGGTPIFEVASWNIEWFGDTGFGPSDEALQLQNVTAVIADGGYDVWGLVEVVSSAQFEALVDALPGYDGFLSNDATIAGGAAEYTASEQKLGFVYDTSRVQVLAKQLLFASDDFEFAGRPPLQVQARLTAGASQLDVTFIVVHLKAGASAADRDRRISAAALLKGHIDTALTNANVLVLGDFNDDVDRSIVWNSSVSAYYDTPFRSIIDDAADFHFVTTPLSQAGQRSTVSFNDVIDHHLASNELDALVAGPPEIIRPDQWPQPVANYGNSTSDHYPVLTRYSVSGSLTPAKTVILNEVLYDEPGTLYDKEFVELVNTSTAAIDLGGWTISDSSQVRHTFASGTTLQAGKAIVVFGNIAEAGGLSNAVGASGGQLSFHPSDSAVLKDQTGTVVDALSFSTSYGDGISANRATDGDPDAAWVAHDSLSAAPSSAGIRASGAAW